LAAFAVAEAHTTGFWNILTGQPLKHWMHVGTIGVDVFFILSGFVIWETATRWSDGFGFFKARWLRVAPTYYVLSIPWLLYIIWRGENPWPALGATLSFIPLSPKGLVSPLNPVGWTLCFELLFYTSVSVAVWRSWAQWPLLGLLAVLVALGLPYVGNPILLEFLIGAALLRRPDNFRPTLGLVAFLGGVATIGVLAGTGLIGWLHDGAATFSGRLSGFRVVMFGGPAFAMVWGAMQMEPWARGHFARLLGQLGDASFSLYLVNFGVLAMLEFAWSRSGWPLWLFPVAALSLAVASGVAAYIWIERPLVRALKPRPRAIFVPAE
jgi:exopolysaccharide production protein ExoZ